MSVAVALEPGTQLVAVDAIEVRVRRRHRDETNVASLAASINTVGLLHPITISTEGVLVAGLHRLEAVRSLGHAFIKSEVVDVDDLTAQEIEIEENLRNSPLSRLEVAEHTDALRRIWEERGRRAAVRADPELTHPSVIGADPDYQPPYTMGELGAQRGVSPRTVRDELRVASMPADVRDKVRGSWAANSLKELLELSEVQDPAEQAQLADLLAEGVSTVHRAKQRLHGTPETETADTEDDADLGPSGAYDDPGADVAERYDVADVDVQVHWKQENARYRVRVIGGEERTYPREMQRHSTPKFEFKVGQEAFEPRDRAKWALCEGVARQLFAALGDSWPPPMPKKAPS